MRPSLGALVAILALGCALAWPMQGRSLGENSNYALVKALASGTPSIDRTRFEVGDLPAGDFRTFNGHTYSDKAPGLAFVTLPAYVVLRGLGLRTSGDPTEALWALRLWSAVLPALLLLLVARGLAERVAPGYGTATAVTIGAGTLILPFATLFYSHVLSAFLLLASFALLWKEREQPPRLALVVGAGSLVGFAVATEYPTALAAVVYGLYAILRAPRLPRAVAYSAGVLAGVTPLLAYNKWAFGSVAHLSYFGDELSRGSLEGRLDPSLINGLFTYLSMPGLLVLSPVLACGLVGIGLLFSAGKRAEALVIASVLTAFTSYNASLPGVEYDAFLSGPRYLLPALPLLGVPIALAFRRWPFTTAALALVSVILMSVMTASHVYTGAGADPRWFDAVVDRAFPTTAASVVGVTGWYAIIPFFLALGIAIVCAAVATRDIRSSPRDQALAGLAVLAWAAAAVFAPTADVNGARYAGYAGVLLVLLAFVATVVAVSLAAQPRGRSTIENQLPESSLSRASRP
jgi:hypothetical protein